MPFTGQTWYFNANDNTDQSTPQVDTYNRYLIQALNNVPVTVKAGSGSIMGYNIINPNGSVAYAKFYPGTADNNSASFSASTISGRTPVMTLQIPASGSITVHNDGFPIHSFTSGLTIMATSAVAINSGAVLGTGLFTEILYK